jgi:hypothetical protein
MLSEIDSGVCPFCRFQNEDGALLCDRCVEEPPPMTPSPMAPLPVAPAPALETGLVGVVCPFCAFLNDPGSLFCEQCTSDLNVQLIRPDKKRRWGVWCVYCHFRNDEADLYCLQCRSDLTGMIPGWR